MRRGHPIGLLGVLVLALGCEKLLGIKYTERGEASGAAGGAQAGTMEAGGRAGAAEAGGMAGAAGAAGQAGTAEAGGMTGAAGAAGQAGIAEAGGMAGAAGAGEPTELLLSPLELPLGSLSLWLDAGTGVTKWPDGSIAVWRDQSRLQLPAEPSSDTTAPTPIQKVFGQYPGIKFDGIDDLLKVPDVSALQVGTESFVLELVVINLSDKCCQQMIFMKEQDFFPYAGVSAAINFYTSLGNHTPPTTGEFATFLTLTPDFVSTPFSDSEDYRDGKPRVVSMLRTGTELSIRVNGQVLGSVASEDVDASAAGYDLFIGGHPDATLFFKGFLAEIVLARGVTVYEALALDRSLRVKYAEALGIP